MSRCRVDGIEVMPPASHADFFFPTVGFAMTRLADGRTFGSRMRRRTAWRPGDKVTVGNALLKAQNA